MPAKAVTAFDLSSFLETYQARSNSQLSASLKRQYPSSRLGEAITYACLNGGKRIRPILVYAAALASGAAIETADSAAVAVEMIHSYSLVHDDLPAMDDDDLRRGKPTVHKAFDEATAVLVGDALQSLAFEILSQRNEAINADTAVEMLATLAQASGPSGMAGGQAYDFEASGKALSLDQLELMHSLKTGELIKCSVQLGALCSQSVTDKQLSALSRYASCIGLAFQVQDDILDVTADTATLGKPQGSDDGLDKPTYVSLLGLEAAKTHAGKLSIDAIDALSDFNSAADPLRELASYIVNRRF